EVAHVPDEPPRLLGQLVTRGLGTAGRQRVQETPAVRLAHQDHPLLRIAEIGEIGIVPRVVHIQVDLEIDQHVPLFEGAPLHRDAKAFAHMGTPAVAREQVACPHGAVTEPQLDVVLGLGEAGQPVSHVEDAGSLLLERGPHHGLELVLRNVDDKGKTSVLSEIAGAHAERGSVGGPVEFPDFVDPVIVAASESRNSSGPTTSSGSPMPVVAAQCSRSPPDGLAARNCGVSMTPGKTVLTRIRYCATSAARDLANGISAPLLAA